jgi:cysteine-rich repeat protein
MRIILGISLLAMAWACGDDSEPVVDSGADAIDTGVGDASMDSDVVDAPPPEPMCGNAMIEAGESCDDGNDATGDGCTPECLLEARCGDGMTMSGEVCDDGNHLDGDGCRGDCASDESCGNSVIDIGAAEVCDDGNTMAGDGCAADCSMVEGCGDGAIAGGEECDDGNTDRWDGCGPDCRNEQSLVLDTLAVADPEIGCDLNADGVPDNLFATALGRLMGINNAQFESSIDAGVLLLLLPFYGLDDPADDDFFVMSVAAAIDSDTDRDNNFTGMADLLANPDSLRPDGLPRTPFPGVINGSMLDAGPFDASILLIINPVFPETMVMRNAFMRGRVSGSGGTITALDEGQICGALPMNGLAAYGNPLRGVTGFEAVDGCDGQELTSFADVAVAGASVLGLSTTPVQPDVDVDGDGLERFEVLRDGPAGCQPVVSACIDGDGTRVEGADCDLDPRFADGVSATFIFTAVSANIIRVAP